MHFKFTFSVLRESIQKNKINLKFHEFKYNNVEQKIIFLPVLNREQDLKKSKTNNLFSVLSSEYDNVKHAVSTTLKHKIVYEEIELKIKLENKKEDEIMNEPFLEVEELLKKLKQKKEFHDCDKNDLELILQDLHKLGLIVYFKKKSLCDTIIPNPKWFNLVFKYILDLGRKKVSLLLQKIHYKLVEEENPLKESTLKILTHLRGNSEYERVEDIWYYKEELEKSNFDKTSYQDELMKLEKLVEEILSTKNSKVLELEEFQNFSSISQKIIFINEDDLNRDLIGKILSEYQGKGDHVYIPKKEFLMDIFSQFDFVIPTIKVESKTKYDKKRIFIIPLLFPHYNPLNSSKKSFENFEEKNKWKIQFENEWIVEYFLPFKPSAFWKLLFMRLRGCCVGINDTEREMVEEIYWLNGFSFYLTERDRTKIKSVVKLEIIDILNKVGEVKMNLTIKSNLNDMNLFYSSLHQTIQTFVKEWVVSDLYKNITIKVDKIKDSKKIGDHFTRFKMEEKTVLKSDTKESVENFKDFHRFKCLNCDLNFSIFDIYSECDKCKNS